MINTNDVEIKNPLKLPSASAKNIDIALLLMAVPSRIVTSN